MRKSILFAALVAASFCVNGVMASDNVVSQTTFAEADASCDGICYKGTLYNLVMNGKTGYNPVEDQCFHLTTTNGTGSLVVTVKQIGSMPGYITLEIPVSVSEAGVITATKTNRIGYLNIAGAKTPLKLTDLTATVIGGQLNITNCAVKGEYLGTFPASFSFTGTTCDGNGCICSGWKN